jgi:hypothetical protein
MAKGVSEVAVEAAVAKEEAEELNFAMQKRESDKFGAGAKRKV